MLCAIRKQGMLRWDNLMADQSWFDGLLEQVWWSPCPSRGCPEDEEINIVVDTCIDHCLLLEQNPKIEIVPHPTKSSSSPRLNNLDDLDDLDFKISKKKQVKDSAADLQVLSPSEVLLTTENRTDRLLANLFGNETEESEESDESWVAGSGEAAFFLLDMHPDLGEPIEQLGIEVEDKHEDVTNFIQRFGEKLLWSKGVNVTELEIEDLRCGGIVLRHNITISEKRLQELAEDCMVQKCEFLRGGPEVCPSDYKESDDKIFWIYFGLRFLGTFMLSGNLCGAMVPFRYYVIIEIAIWKPILRILLPCGGIF